MTDLVEIKSPELDRFMQRVDKALRDPSPYLDLLGNVAVNLSKILFTKSENPYGEAWKPIKHRGTTKTTEQYTDSKGRTRTREIWTGGIPLRLTGILMNSINHATRANPPTTIVGPGVEYGIIHQLGLGYVHQRAYLPTESGGLPKRWERIMVDALISKLQADLNV